KVAEQHRQMRSALDAQRMLIPSVGTRPTRLQARIDEEFGHGGKLERGVGVLRVCPYGAVPARRRSHGIPHHVEQSNLSLGQASTGFGQVVHIPGDRMKVLTIAGIESAQS